MKIFEKLFPSETLEMELPISKQKFLESFRNNTTAGEINFVAEWFEPFTSHKTPFKGNITSTNTFEIKRFRRIFKFLRGLAVADGSIQENNGDITITCVINAFRGYIKTFIIFFSIFLSIAVLSQVVFLFQDGDTSPLLISILVMFIYIFIFLFISKIALGSAVKNLKNELSQEFKSYIN